jgi:hypothetical protein
MPKFIEIYANLANEKPTDTRAHTQGPTRGRACTGSAPERDMERLKEKLSVSLSTTSLLVQHLNWKRGRKTNQSGMRVATPQLSFYFSLFFFLLAQSLFNRFRFQLLGFRRYAIAFKSHSILSGFGLIFEFCLNFPPDLLFLFFQSKYMNHNNNNPKSDRL